MSFRDLIFKSQKTKEQIVLLLLHSAKTKTWEAILGCSSLGFERVLEREGASL